MNETAMAIRLVPPHNPQSEIRNDMRICGIDPGLQRTGYGVLDAEPARPPRLIEAGVIRTDPKAPLPDRLMEIERGLAAVFAEFAPHTVVIEQLYAHYAHPRTAILMGHARGVIVLTAARAGARVASYGATKIKKALVGSGHASKAQVQRAIQSVFRLAQPPEPADVADALAVALCHAYQCARTVLPR
jgi:crossover junction endodeoxyribonuclease RuvC